MKYIKGFFHSIYFSYIGLFGGVMDGKNKTYYMLWTIHIRSDVSTTWKNMRCINIGKSRPMFYFRGNGNKIKNYK